MPLYSSLHSLTRGLQAGLTMQVEMMQFGTSLTPKQWKQAHRLVHYSMECFHHIQGKSTQQPTRTKWEPESRLRENTHSLAHRMRETLKQELQAILNLGVMEESCNDWGSPIALVPIRDGITQFCIGFWKFNDISKFNVYLMPQVDKLLDQLIAAWYITAIKLTKGCWQILLTLESREKNRVCDPPPCVLYQFQTVLFGLYGAPGYISEVNGTDPTAPLGACGSICRWCNGPQPDMGRVPRPCGCHVAVPLESRSNCKPSQVPYKEDWNHLPAVYPREGLNLATGGQGPGLAEVSISKQQNPGPQVSRISWILLMVFTSILFNYEPSHGFLKGDHPRRYTEAKNAPKHSMHPNILHVKGLPMPGTSLV